MPYGPLPRAIKVSAASASTVSVGTSVPLTKFNPLVVSSVAATCANFSIGIFRMFFICCIVAENAPAAVAKSLGNIPSRYEPNPSGIICRLTCMVLDFATVAAAISSGCIVGSNAGAIS